jgi:hypothetical protein
MDDGGTKKYVFFCGDFPVICFDWARLRVFNPKFGNVGWMDVECFFSFFLFPFSFRSSHSGLNGGIEKVESLFSRGNFSSIPQRHCQKKKMGSVWILGSF